ncbi:MAG: hypothetical protein HC805_07370 [Alkalinema sp. RL_2_19]|nr:hypothetical protein [Alkalinema sp. RL_2_19]
MGFDRWFDQFDAADERANGSLVDPMDALAELSGINSAENTAAAPTLAKYLGGISDRD